MQITGKLNHSNQYINTRPARPLKYNKSTCHLRPHPPCSFQEVIAIHMMDKDHATLDSSNDDVMECSGASIKDFRGITSIYHEQKTLQTVNVWGVPKIPQMQKVNMSPMSLSPPYSVLRALIEALTPTAHRPGHSEPRRCVGCVGIQSRRSSRETGMGKKPDC